MDRRRDGWPRRTGVILVAGIALVFGALWALPDADAQHEPDGIPDAWSEVRRCESHGAGGYTANTGNGFYGAYQFDRGTWPGAVSRAGHPEHSGATANNAPAWVQDAAAEQLRSERGVQPWPTCGRLYNAALPQPDHRPPAPPSGPTREDLRERGYPHFGRPGDDYLRCDVDGDGLDEQVIRRANLWYVDLDHRGGRGELGPISYGRADDEPACGDTDGDRVDEMIVVRGDSTYGKRSWRSGAADWSFRVSGAVVTIEAR